MIAEGFLIKVSTAAMRDTADSVKNYLSSVRTAFEKLDSTVAQTISYWESDAADHHRSTYSGYKDRMATAIKRIDEQVTDLGQMAGVYEQTEASNASVSADLPDDILT